MIIGIHETIESFQELVNDLIRCKALRTSLNKQERNKLVDIEVSLQIYLGIAGSIHNLSNFLDNVDHKKTLVKKLNDDDLSELTAIVDKLTELKFILPKK
jgi:hypothetical protein